MPGNAEDDDGKEPTEECLREFAEKERNFYNARLEKAQQRALAVITTSGGLVTLLTGIAAFWPGFTDMPVPWPSAWLLGSALASFVVAVVIAALSSGQPWAKTDKILESGGTEPSKEEVYVKTKVTPDKLTLLWIRQAQVLKGVNNTSASRIRWAIRFQAGAVILLTLAIIGILYPIAF